MRNFALKAQMAIIMATIKATEKFKESVIKDQRGEVGVGAVLSIVLVLIVFAFIVVPQARSFVAKMFTDLMTWYNGLNLFPSA